ncbi:Gfo/Idh/MocA family protein [Arthrobacter sp. MDT2-16]
MTGDNQRIRYAIVGTGHRAEVYVDAILGEHASEAELVAVLDTNATRATYYARRASVHGVRVILASPSDMADTIARHKIDRVIVTTPDALHAHYIVIALRAGADVIVEKPLTTSAEMSAQIARAVEETGRNVTVTFNYRYSPRNTALKQVVQDGTIGEVTAVHFEWVLDTAHGADYFRRWHRDKSNSGGLLIHKASHHFDLVNWWLADSPSRVYATGGLRFYGSTNAAQRGLHGRPERGTHDGMTDAFQLDLREDPRLTHLYLDAEHEDGYLRDRDVFDGEISIEDTLSAVVNYTRGASLTYSLIAYSPWEGYRVSITGTKGRVELDVVERAAVLTSTSRVLGPSATVDVTGSTPARQVGEHLVVQPHWEAAYEVPLNGHNTAGHGGGDDLLMSHLFTNLRIDPLGRPATWRDGVRSIAVGIAGNASLESGRAVDIRTLELGIDLNAPFESPHTL